MKNKIYAQKIVVFNLLSIRFENFIFALAGILSFAVLKDSEWEQIFFVCFSGFFTLYNLIKLFFLLMKYQELKIDQPTFNCSYETAKKALSNNIPEMIESIEKKQKQDAGQI